MAKTKAAKQRAKARKQAVKALTGAGTYAPVRGVPPRQLKRGSGKFSDVLKYIPRGIGGISGLMSGGLGGARAGWDSGAALSKKIGWGAYGTVPSSEVNYATPMPAMHSTSEACTISRTEYLGDLYTSSVAGQFMSTVYAFNPGMFLYWGSKLADLFQEWRLEGAVVSFRSRSSSYTSTTTLGTVMICMDYNAANPSFTTKQQFQECSGCASCSIDQNCDCYIEADKAASPLKNLYVRTGDPPTGADIHLYDLGKLQVATQGCAASANVGELFISYHITYTKPILLPGGIIDGAHYTLTTPTTSAYFGTSRVKVVDALAITFTTNSTILFPAGTIGTYMIQMQYTGTAASVTNPSGLLTNLEYVATMFGGGSGWSICPANGTTTTKMSLTVFVRIVNPSGASSLAYSGGTIPTDVTSAELIVTQVSSALL